MSPLSILLCLGFQADPAAAAGHPDPPRGELALEVALLAERLGEAEHRFSDRPRGGGGGLQTREFDRALRLIERRALELEASELDAAAARELELAVFEPLAAARFHLESYEGSRVGVARLAQELEELQRLAEEGATQLAAQRCTRLLDEAAQSGYPRPDLARGIEGIRALRAALLASAGRASALPERARPR